MGITWTGGWSSDGLVWRQAHGVVPWRTGGIQASSRRAQGSASRARLGLATSVGQGGGLEALTTALLSAQPQAPSCTGGQTELASHQGGATTSDIPVFWNRVLSNALL